jgi:predicted Zn-dependent protease
MTGVTRRAFAGGCSSCAALALLGCQTTGTSPGPVAPGYRPAQATDESDLWRTMDRAESDIKGSRFLVRDPDVNAYVRDIACRLAADHCSDLRVYILRTPVFNATMAPNGMMQVYTGLLLRARNEAQLAAVIGHEIGHYLHRHSLERLRNRRATMDFAAFLGIGLAVAGAGAIGDLVRLAAIASLYSYNRDQERDADDVGIRLMAKAGYEPLQASEVWEQLISERNADENADARRGNVFFATHPSSEERAQTLREKAAQLSPSAAESYQDRYRQRLLALRGTLFQDELRLRQYGRTLKLFEMLHAEGQTDSQLSFYTGEVYRLRNGSGDLAKAMIAYEQAVAAGSEPPETHRGIGIVQMRLGDRVAADTAFKRYLQLRPTADDAEIIRSYMHVQG